MERNVPKLRFKEFNDEWIEYKLGEKTCIYDGTHQTPKYTDHGVKFVSVENIEDIYGTDKFISEEDYENGFKIKPQLGDIFMTRITAGVIGATAIVDKEEELAFYVSLALIRVIDKNLNSLFLKKYIESIYFKKELNKRIIHVAFPKKINLGDIGECSVNLPSLQEQERIANFLTKVDKIIEKQEEKVKNLENYKKGMMQKIFSQEIRFKDENGEEYPEWEETKLGELLTFYSTNSLSRECLNFEIGEVQNIHYGDIHMKFPTILDVKKYSIPYINSNIDITKYQEDSFCKDGDLIIADASEDYADIGKSIEVCNIGNKKILAGLHTILARDNKNLTSSGFKGYMMQCEFVRKQIKVLAAGAKVLGISKANLEKMNIKLPSLQEQQRIADFLTKMDLSIEKECYKLKELKKWKKGLLQQMFV